MILTFAEALAILGGNAASRIANGARPPGNYLFNTFLPERTQPDYHVEAANMLVRSTMAGLVAMDSPYPPGGNVEVSTFLENSAKLGITSTLTEQAMRQLQTLLRLMQFDGTLSNDFLQKEALNFVQKVIVQAQLDRAEWMRGQALVFGRLDWAFNQKTLAIDYGYLPAQFLTTRTDAAATAYGDTGSLFWTDMAAARRQLRNNIRAVILNSTTMDEILENPVNSLEILSQDNQSFRVRRFRTIGGNTVPDSDIRYQMDFIVYDEEAEILDTTAGSLNLTQTVKFMPDGKVLFIGQNRMNGYRVGTGSTDDPATDMELGWHAICPTVEGGGAPGRWARLYTPEGYPMHLRGEGASNELPVIMSPQAVVVATTEIMP